MGGRAVSTKAQETKDAELLALASLCVHETMWMQAENDQRLKHGLSPAYTCDGCAAELLRKELTERGYTI